MTTFNGPNDNLRFLCKSCSHGKEDGIVVDLENKNDKHKLWRWLNTHSANGGKYINVPIVVDLEKIPIKERTNKQHRKLIKKYGGVRQYLLSMGKFKDGKK